MQSQLNPVHTVYLLTAHFHIPPLTSDIFLTPHFSPEDGCSMFLRNVRLYKNAARRNVLEYMDVDLGCNAVWTCMLVPAFWIQSRDSGLSPNPNSDRSHHMCDHTYLCMSCYQRRHRQFFPFTRNGGFVELSLTDIGHCVRNR
jgi:hypothetical protein